MKYVSFIIAEYLSESFHTYKFDFDEKLISYGFISRRPI